MPGMQVNQQINSLEGGRVENIIGGSVVIERLQNRIRTLTDAVEALSINSAEKEPLLKQIQEYEKLAKDVAEGALKRQEAEFLAKLQEQKIETQTQRIIRLLDKDLVSVLIGGTLLLIITISLIVMMSRGLVESRLLENAFLILLGYFFGQGVGARTNNAPPKDKTE